MAFDLQHLIAFNAIISKDFPQSALARPVDEFSRDRPEAELTRNRGSRHQSAMFYTSRVPNSFAFVVSQDGGVSAFHNPGDGTLMCERGLLD